MHVGNMSRPMGKHLPLVGVPCIFLSSKNIDFWARSPELIKYGINWSS